MSTTQKNALALFVILTVCLGQLFSKELNVLLGIGSETTNIYWSIIGQVLKYVLPVVLLMLLFFKPAEIFLELGLAKGIWTGLRFAFLFTLPMLIGYFLMGTYSAEQGFLVNILKAFKDGFREEIYFRAFLFGLLFKHVRLGFLPSVAINGLIFGLLHIYQAHSFVDSIGVFVITFIGATLFAWLYVEWEFNLWLPIFLHMFMNLYWHIFSTESSALGGIWLNLPRALTIAISIYATIKIVRKTGALKINRSTLFWNA